MGHGRARFESRYWGAHFMEFLHSRPDIVRSESQRSLLGRWNVARGAAALPAWQELHPDTLAVPRDNLSFLDVVAVNGGTRFQIRFHGVRIAELYSSVSCVGRFLDEVVPPASREVTLATYRHAVAHRLPVYTISDTRDWTHCPLRTAAAATHGRRSGRCPHPGLARNREPGGRVRQLWADDRNRKVAGLRPVYRDSSVVSFPIARRDSLFLLSDPPDTAITCAPV